MRNETFPGLCRSRSPSDHRSVAPVRHDIILGEDLTGWLREVSFPIETKLGRWRGLHQPTGGTGRHVQIPDASARVGRIDRSSQRCRCARRCDRPKPVFRRVVLDGDRRSDLGVTALPSRALRLLLVVEGALIQHDAPFPCLFLPDQDAPIVIRE